MSSWLQWSAACLLLASVCLTATRAACMSGFESYGDKCFRVITAFNDWESSELLCQSLGHRVTLASARNMEEFHFLRRLLRRHQSQFSSDTARLTVAWLAANDLSVEGDFRWTDSNNPVLSAMWAANQPNNFLGSEDCAGLFINQGDNYLNDYNCDSSQPSICQHRRW